MLHYTPMLHFCDYLQDADKLAIQDQIPQRHVHPYYLQLEILESSKAIAQYLHQPSFEYGVYWVTKQILDISLYYPPQVNS